MKTFTAAGLVVIFIAAYRFLAAGLVPVKIIRREMLGVDGPLL